MGKQGFILLLRQPSSPAINMPQIYTQKITISEQTMTQEVDGETVILDLKSENYFGLDIVATRIWQLLQVNGDLQSAFDILLAEYDVQADQLKSDIDTLIENLQEAGLVRLQGA